MEIVFPSEVELTEISIVPRQRHNVDYGHPCPDEFSCAQRYVFKRSERISRLNLKSLKYILHIIIFFRLRNLEMLIDDNVISKALSNLNHSRWPMYFLGASDLQYLQICNDCETMKSGSSVKFLWKNPDHSPAEIVSIYIFYRIPGMF